MLLGKLRVSKHLALNKIGHGVDCLYHYDFHPHCVFSALHLLDPAFKEFTFQEKFKVGHFGCTFE